MSEELTQEQADHLLALEKIMKNREPVVWPGVGGKLAIDLLSVDQSEEFVVNATRSYVKLSKVSLNTRTRGVVILARLEIDGAPHRNPDDQEMECPHIHLYREGFGDKWAFPLPPNVFSNLADQATTFREFLRFCNVRDFPGFGGESLI